MKMVLIVSMTLFSPHLSKMFPKENEPRIAANKAEYTIWLSSHPARSMSSSEATFLEKPSLSDPPLDKDMKLSPAPLPI